MKRIILFFAVCLGLSVSQTTFADDAETVRAASKRGTTTITANQSTGRSVATNTKRPDSTQNASKNSRTAVKPQQKVSSRSTVAKQVVKPREQTTKQTTRTNSKKVSTTSRAASSRAVNSRNVEPKINSAVVRTSTSKKRSANTIRAADLNTTKITNIKSLNFSKCKTVYYDCMDEFCANKDSNLRRCACSSRIHEFDNIKKQLADAEDKMLDFNQRLLTVNLDKEDAAAINVATEGELAFNKKDTTESEKLLQKITKSLNSSGDSKINNNLSSISLSLDVDSAWDGIDSVAGIATSSKNGVDLYNAALPVCVEMAREVCTDDELAIAKSGYTLTIQQDCDTVAKSYKTQYNNAMEKIYESGALLDMSRLNVYQQRNSDDTLTCRKKILEQLSDSAVCGENLYKCLDTTGQYIDPSTGAAFLSENLYELADLLKEPNEGEKWTNAANNDKFVNFLNSKKEFLEPAIEQCQDISDMIWKDFLEDALAQIKLAQNSKLEEIKRSCTTLVAECKTTSATSLTDFDARALSTFSVAADKTVNTMCQSVETSCSELMAKVNLTDDNPWSEAVASIATDESYKKIIDTCTQIGRDCIVQQCNGTSGNFALCQKVTDDNRRAILNRNACWQEVLDCVASADNLDNMNVTSRDTFYMQNYNYDIETHTDMPKLCENNDDKACLITEQIWGNCEYAPDAYDITTNSDNTTYKTSNKILTPTSGSSLLSWFATNTGTSKESDSCNSKGCPVNHFYDDGVCTKMYNGTKTSDCGTPTKTNEIINVTSDITNFCESGKLDVYGNCCVGNKSNGVCVPDGYQAARLQDLSCTSTDANDYLCPKSGNMTLYCVTNSADARPVTYYTDVAEYSCEGDNSMWIIVDSQGHYFKADQNSAYTGQHPTMYYNEKVDNCPTDNSAPTKTQCKYKYNNGWSWDTGCDPATENFLINYQLTN